MSKDWIAKQVKSLQVVNKQLNGSVAPRIWVYSMKPMLSPFRQNPINCMFGFLLFLLLDTSGKYLSTESFSDVECKPSLMGGKMFPS